MEFRLCADLLYTGSEVLDDGCLLVRDGHVARTYEGGVSRADVDLRGLDSLAIPGVADIHVHLRGLQLSYKEDESTGTAAAASGCVALVADMPNTRPELRDPASIKMKLYSLANSSVVDYTVYSGVPLEKGLALEVASMPIAGFKIYPEDLVRPELVTEVLEAAEEAGQLVVLHPEDENLFQSVDYGWRRMYARPCASEARAVEALFEISRSSGSKPKVHVTHATCPETVEAAKKRGWTVDATPHHLFLVEDEVVGPSDSWSKVNPPLRGHIDRQLITQKLLEGLVDAIASDHAPHHPREKWMPPYSAPPGFPWLEWWPAFSAYRLLRLAGLPMFYHLVSRAPNEILGLKKPCLDDGCEATASILVLKRTRIYHKGYTKAAYTPALGMESYDCLATMIRGKLVYTAWGGVDGGFKGRLATESRD